MGGDSASVSGWETRVAHNPKVFILKDFIIGYTSSFRMGQLLQYNLELPLERCSDSMMFMVKDMVPAIRECLKRGGFAKVENNEESGGEFLIGYDGKLFQIQSDFQVSQFRDGLSVVGVGAPYALGALRAFITRDLRDPATAIYESLKVAEYFCMGVSRPFYVLELKGEMDG